MYRRQLRLPTSIYLPDAIDEALRTLDSELKITRTADEEYVSIQINDESDSEAYGAKIGDFLNLALRISIEATVSSLKPEDE